MRHKIELFRKLTRMLFELFFVSLLIIFFENVLLKQEPKTRNILLLAGMYLISLVVKNLSRMRIVALGIHIGVGVIIFRLPIDMVSRVALLVILVYLMFSAMEYIGQGRRLKPIDDAPWPSFFIILILYMFSIYTKSYTFQTATCVVAVMMLVTYYVMTYLEGLKSYIESTKDVQGLPLNQIVAKNNMIVLAIIILLAVCMVGSFMLDYSRLVMWLKDIAVAILKLITSVFMIISILLNNLVSSEENSMFGFSLEESATIQKHGKQVGNSFVILLYAAVGIIAMIIVAKLLKYILRLLFAKHKFAEDIVEVAESTSDVLREKNVKGWLSKMTNEEKLRRKYKKCIEAYRYDIRLRKSATCRELQQEINHNDLGDVSELTDMYATVRYGDVQVDKSMLRRANALIKK